MHARQAASIGSPGDDAPVRAAYQVAQLAPVDPDGEDGRGRIAEDRLARRARRAVDRRECEAGCVGRPEWCAGETQGSEIELRRHEVGIGDDDPRSISPGQARSVRRPGRCKGAAGQESAVRAIGIRDRYRGARRVADGHRDARSVRRPSVVLELLADGRHLLVCEWGHADDCRRVPAALARKCDGAVFDEPKPGAVRSSGHPAANVPGSDPNLVPVHVLCRDLVAGGAHELTSSEGRDDIGVGGCLGAKPEAVGLGEERAPCQEGRVGSDGRFRRWFRTRRQARGWAW